VPFKEADEINHRAFDDGSDGHSSDREYTFSRAAACLRSAERARDDDSTMSFRSSRSRRRRRLLDLRGANPSVIRHARLWKKTMLLEKLRFYARSAHLNRRR